MPWAALQPGDTDHQLAAGSAAIDAGGLLNVLVLPANDVLRQYVKHQSSEARPQDPPLGIGAFEFAP